MNNKQENEYIEPSSFLAKDISESGMQDIVLDLIDCYVKNDLVEFVKDNNTSEIPFIKLLENDINLLIQDEILDKLPIAKTLNSIFKTGSAIRNYMFQKKLIEFLAGFKNHGKHIKSKIEKSLSNPKDKAEMGEKLIFALEYFEEIQKAGILCKLFIAYINQMIDYRTFKELLFALQEVNFDYIATLVEFYDEKISGSDYYEILLILSNLRLIKVNYNSPPTVGQIFPSPYYTTTFHKNDLGNNFIKVLKI